MTLGQILLAIYLVVVGAAGLGWIAIQPRTLAWFAVITGVVLLIQGFGVVERFRR